jgi:hypothetical protein
VNKHVYEGVLAFNWECFDVGPDCISSEAQEHYNGKRVRLAIEELEDEEE